MILDIDPKQKKKKGAEWFELDEDLTEEWILEHQAFLVQEMRIKIEKKFAKENEKLVADGQKEMKAKELTERLTAADDLEKKLKKENKTKKVETEGKGPSVEKCESNIKKLDERITAMRLQAEDREGNKEVALGTSKIVSNTTHNLVLLTDLSRITLTHVLRLSLRRSSAFRSRSSFQRLSVTSSLGPLNRSKMKMTGNFKPRILLQSYTHAPAHTSLRHSFANINIVFGIGHAPGSFISLNCIAFTSGARRHSRI
jgi:hypothetical protein